jgi:hypothetical protein
MAATTLIPNSDSARFELLPVTSSSHRCILALDLGTTTGWALRGHDGLITSGTVSLPPRPLRRRRHALPALHQLADRDSTGCPGPSPPSGSRRSAATPAPTRAHVYGGLMATLTAWAELRGVPYEGVPVGTIKRHATGKGNADKAAMIAAARARGFSPADDNEADAIAILLWAIETKGVSHEMASPRLWRPAPRSRCRSSARAGANRACWRSPPMITA